jgi:hypothetical protein
MMVGYIDPRRRIPRRSFIDFLPHSPILRRFSAAAVRGSYGGIAARRLLTSRGFPKDLTDAARDRLDGFAGHLLSESAQFLGLFVQQFELLAGMFGP